MSVPPPKFATMEAAIGRVLQLGVLLAIMCALTGGVIHFIRDTEPAPSFATFNAADALFTSPLLTLTTALKGNGLALMQLAVLILIATPIIRVFASLVLFITKRDLLYSCITLLVIAALAAGLAGGAH